MADLDWLTYVSMRLPELWLRTGEHILLTVASTGLGILLGVPLGILAFRHASLRAPLMGGIGIVQTIPSLAMLAILLALTSKIGAIPAMIALTLYALLPIVRNTVTGLDGVSHDVIEAARGVGMTELQELHMVRLPLAMPYMVAGIRTAAVIGVGIATLAAFIGAGGLGEFINRGLALSNTRLIFLGAIPAAILALIVDLSIAIVQWGLRPVRGRKRSSSARCLRAVAIAQPLALAAVGILACHGDYAGGGNKAAGSQDGGSVVRIGSKRFSEQFILGEMVAQVIEDRTKLRVERLFNLGGTMINHEALKRGEIDMYPEYTGTALTAIMEMETVNDPNEAYDIVRREYLKRFDLEWHEPFGFNNAYSITVRAEDARKNGWQKISDLKKVAHSLEAGWTAEFSERPDGYAGLRKAYGLEFGGVRDLDPAIMYQAIASGQVDVICAYTTDGRIPAYHLQPLIDDEHFFPPYDAALVVRAAVLKAHPELRGALSQLGGILDNKTMQRLNYLVDEKQRPSREVARELLESRGLIKRRDHPSGQRDKSPDKG